MADSEDNRSPRWATALALAGLSGVYLLSFVLPAESDRVWCALRAATGIPCPLCGMSRAFIRISSGDLRGAVALHALAPIAYLAGVFLVVVLAFDLPGSSRLNMRTFGNPLRPAALVATVFALFWAVRLLYFWKTGALREAFRLSPAGKALLGG